VKAIASLDDGVLSWAETGCRWCLLRRLMALDMLALPGHLGLSFTDFELGRPRMVEIISSYVSFG
jgi:hypothetical protein